ncbi:MAG TPA: hypothetical protein VFZ49_05560, partial [Pyrinomonadaceae bacterium]
HGVKLIMKPMPGVKIEDVLNDFEKDAEGRYELPNLQAGSPLDIVVRFKVPERAAGSIESIAELKIEYIDQISSEARSVDVSVIASFDTVDVVLQLPQNAAVSENVQLLMNARARKEMMERMDEGDFVAAAHTLKSALALTDMRFALAASPVLATEREELRSLDEMLAHRSNDPMARKRMAYRRESLRKGK